MDYLFAEGVKPRHFKNEILKRRQNDPDGIKMSEELKAAEETVTEVERTWAKESIRLERVSADLRKFHYGASGLVSNSHNSLRSGVSRASTRFVWSQRLWAAKYYTITVSLAEKLHYNAKVDTRNMQLANLNVQICINIKLEMIVHFEQANIRHSFARWDPHMFPIDKITRKCKLICEWPSPQQVPRQFFNPASPWNFRSWPSYSLPLPPS